MLITPFFPALRARLAAQVRERSQTLRRIHFPLLVEQLRALLPAQLLSSEDEGTNSRDRIFSLRLTFECFVWQLLKPETSCREVVRAVQALFQSLGLGRVDEGTSAFIQARQRLPRERLERAVTATAQIADRPCRRSGHAQRSASQSGRLLDDPVGRYQKESEALSPTLGPEARLRLPSAQVAGSLQPKQRGHPARGHGPLAQS